MLRVNRWVLWQATGEAGEGLEACHRCDRALCVQPEHLYWGTRADNVRDIVKRYWKK